MRVLLVLLVACGGTKPASSSGSTPPHKRGACVSLAAAQTEEASARDRGRANLLAAIDKKQLTVMNAEAKEVPLRDRSHEWRVDGTLLLAPETSKGCGGPYPSPASGIELVKNAAGEVWVVVPSPHVTGQRSVDTCACRSQQSSNCGGAAPPPLQLAYELPPGSTFRGQQVFEFDLEDVRVVYADQYPGSSCPPMPPPPP